MYQITSYVIDSFDKNPFYVCPLSFYGCSEVLFSWSFRSISKVFVVCQFRKPNGYKIWLVNDRFVTFKQDWFANEACLLKSGITFCFSRPLGHDWQSVTWRAGKTVVDNTTCFRQKVKTVTYDDIAFRNFIPCKISLDSFFQYFDDNLAKKLSEKWWIPRFPCLYNLVSVVWQIHPILDRRE